MEETNNTQSMNVEQSIDNFRALFTSLEAEIGKLIVGNEHIVRSTLAAIFAGGHVLLEGAPGLGKTRLVRAVADAFGLVFKRIQFTPDLMPSDVTGTQVLTEDDQGRRAFSFKAGPIFANIVLADEVNRATPKTQSSLLEAMGEHQVTVIGETYQLPEPFFVLATQNPIELEGTYPLPEAQLDRFLLKLHLSQPTSENLKEILDRTTGEYTPEVTAVLGAQQVAPTIDSMKKLVRQVVVSDPLKDVIVRMLDALTPESEYATQAVRTYVRFGPGPRGAQAVLLVAKVYALLDGRMNLSFDDVRQVFIESLRHRIILNFQAEADGVSSDQILSEIRNAK